MTAWPLVCLVAFVSYLVGAIPFGYLVARAHGVDIFRAGSGNIGATNVWRVLGWRWGVLVFLLDFAKGAGPTLVAKWLDPVFLPDTLPVVAGVAAFLGHLFPVYLGFRGGKGVATGAGVIVVLLPLPALAAILTWIVCIAAFRYVSLASLVAAVVLCLVYLAETSAPFEMPAVILSVFCLLAVSLVFVKHRSNIFRLLHGTENSLPDRPAMRHLSKTFHVLAVGLWFGMAVFFSFPVALTLFSTFEKEAQSDTRPT